MSIRVKLLIFFLLISLLPIVTLGLFVVEQMTQRERSFFEESSQHQLRQVSNSFSIVLKGVSENLKLLVESKQIIDADDTLPSYINVPYVSDAESPDQGKAGDLFALLRQVGQTHPNYCYVYLGTSQGDFLMWPATKAKANYDPRKRSWYQRAAENPGQVGRVKAYSFEEDNTALISTGLTFTTSAGVQGVAGIDISLKELTEIAKGVKFGKTGYIIIVEDSGNVIADSRHSENNLKPLAALGDGYKELSVLTSGSEELDIAGVSYTVSVYSSEELGWKFVGLIETAELAEGSRSLVGTIAIVVLSIIIICILVGGVFTSRIVSPIQSASRRLEEIAAGEGDLTQRLESFRKDEMGLLADSFNSFATSIQKIIRNVSFSSRNVESSSLKIAHQAESLSVTSSRQAQAVHQLSTSFNEVVATAGEVARNCSLAAESAKVGELEVEAGKNIVHQMVSFVSDVENFISLSSGSISDLEQDVKSIDVILSNIRGIAEQTNLLALNAAIEAARAGEQGRGFAVVADEVRALAKRTTDSTEQVNSLLYGLVESTRKVSATMHHSLECSQELAKCAFSVSEAFARIDSAVGVIRDMNMQIAAATEEQHQVSDDINSHIMAISVDAGEITKGAETTRLATVALKNTSADLGSIVRCFKID